MKIIGHTSQPSIRTTYAGYYNWLCFISFGKPFKEAYIHCSLSKSIGLNYRRIELQTIKGCFI